MHILKKPDHYSLFQKEVESTTLPADCYEVKKLLQRIAKHYLHLLPSSHLHEEHYLNSTIRVGDK